ncbi:MAG: DUF2171 domain-containing protein [Blastocatellales bacterium]
MVNSSEIREHMKVVGSDGQHVGTVDRVEGDRIKLTKSDPSAHSQHHYIPVNSIASIGQGEVRLRQTAQEVKQQWQGGAAGRTAGGGTR